MVGKYPGQTDKPIIAAMSCGYPVSASSSMYNRCTPFTPGSLQGLWKAHLDYEDSSECWGWLPDTHHMGGSWIQINVMEPKLWVAVETQGNGHHDSWVEKYLVKHSNDGINWTCVD